MTPIDETCSPSISTYAHFIRSVTRSKSLSDARRLHERALRSGLHSNPFIANLLIRMFAHCGDLSMSASLFADISAKDVFSWNIIISAFVLHGEALQAISHFHQMQQHGILPDKCSFVSALSVFLKEEDIIEGKRIHNLAVSLGFDTDLRVGTSLLEMYKRCGELNDVCRASDRLEDMDAFSWNAVISAYATHEESHLALSYFQQMLQEDVLPDEVVFSSAIAACTSSELLSTGKQIHACVVGSSHDSDVFIGTALINMYGKCGSVLYAHKMFKELDKHDTVSWNAMITAFVKNGLFNDALKLYRKMLRESVNPDQATYISLLEACSIQEHAINGMKLHKDIVSVGLDSDILVSTSLLTTYSKCNNLHHAWHVFDNLAMHDLVCWNVMIDTCVLNEAADDALQLYVEMQRRGVIPNKVTLLNVLQACTDETAFFYGCNIHNDIVARSLETDVVIATALVTMYSKCNSLGDAWELFIRIQERNLVSWNTMIAGYIQHGNLDHAFALFQQMHVEGEFPNKVTYLSLLSCIQSLCSLNRLHCYLSNVGLNDDIAIANALILMHGKCGDLKTARLLFHTMSERDVVSWTAMMSAYAQDGLYRDCHFLFEQMQRQGIAADKVAFVIIITAFSNAATLQEGKIIHSSVVESNLESTVDVANALLNMHGKCGNLEDALQTFDGMQTKNKQTYVNMITICANLVAHLNGKLVHCEIVMKGLTLDGLLGNNLINMYGKCGCALDARKVFDQMGDRDIISWSTMITIYAQNGQGKNALMLFDSMQTEKMQPNEVTFLGILSACNHAGLVDDCYQHFISMSRDHGISPQEDHYTCVIDVLSRSGRLEEAEGIILKMPPERRCIPWMTLLGACLIRSDVTRAERAAREVFLLDPQNPVPYVMLANVYANTGRGDDAANVLSSMKQNGLENTPLSDLLRISHT